MCISLHKARRDLRARRRQSAPLDRQHPPVERLLVERLLRRQRLLVCRHPAAAPSTNGSASRPSRRGVAACLIAHMNGMQPELRDRRAVLSQLTLDQLGGPAKRTGRTYRLAGRTLRAARDLLGKLAGRIRARLTTP